MAIEKSGAFVTNEQQPGSIYPCGYAGYAGISGTLHRLLEADPSLLLIDARLKPYSDWGGWNGSELKERYSRQYRWAGKWLGNKHYNTAGDILLADPITGIEGLLTYLTQRRSFVLLCGCPYFDQCHLHTILDLLEWVIAVGRDPGLIMTIPTAARRIVRQVQDRWADRPVPPYSIVHPETIVQPGYGKTLSVLQPWTWILTHPGEVSACGLPAKLLENRLWSTRWRGDLLLHAGAKVDTDFFDRQGHLNSWVLGAKFGEAGEHLAALMPQHRNDYARKSLIGRTELVEVVSAEAAAHQLTENPWYVSSSYAFLLRDPLAFGTPVPVAGQRWIFDVPLSLLEAA